MQVTKRILTYSYDTSMSANIDIQAGIGLSIKIFLDCRYEDEYYNDESS